VLLRRFFEDYKKNEHKDVKVDDILGAADAMKCVKDSLNMYQVRSTTELQWVSEAAFPAAVMMVCRSLIGGFKPSGQQLDVIVHSKHNNDCSWDLWRTEQPTGRCL
jgi:hypothetical protein